MLRWSWIIVVGVSWLIQSDGAFSFAKFNPEGLCGVKGKKCDSACAKWPTTQLAQCTRAGACCISGNCLFSGCGPRPPVVTRPPTLKFGSLEADSTVHVDDDSLDAATAIAKLKRKINDLHLHKKNMKRVKKVLRNPGTSKQDRDVAELQAKITKLVPTFSPTTRAPTYVPTRSPTSAPHSPAPTLAPTYSNYEKALLGMPTPPPAPHSKGKKKFPL
jgi:hypothetical protein